MFRMRWYRSLYWRIGLGLFAFLALMLAAEGALFLWMTDRIAGSMPARSPRRLAVLVASDVGTAMTSNAALDLDAYVRVQYGETLQTFLVILRDGRVVTNHDDVPDALIEAAQARPRRGFGGQRGRGERLEPRGSGLGPRASPPPPRLRVRGEFAPIVVAGATVGRVAVLADGPPFSRVLRQLGPTMGAAAGAVLTIGSVLIAFIVFGPAKRRLRHVQVATEKLGSGDLSARAPEQGGDEVAALARSFNRMADELTERARALEASDTARRQLLADVSHELMTPLTAIRGYVETLAMSGASIDHATRERYVHILIEETHRLERIIGDLLDLARLEGGGTTLRHDRVNIGALFDRVAARHDREIRERGIQLALDAPPAATAWADPDRLEQVLQNLAANALRHTPNGGRVTLDARPDAGGVTIRVRDSGPGIAAEHLPLIFDRFYKADSARKAAGGSGLGLSIVKAIVERHGGTVTAMNDSGAVFEVRLPSPSPGQAVAAG